VRDNEPVGGDDGRGLGMLALIAVFLLLLGVGVLFSVLAPYEPGVPRGTPPAPGATEPFVPVRTP